MSLRLVPSLLLLMGLSACQLAPKAPVGVLVENPLEIEPAAVPLRTEIAIARISEILQNAKLTDVERARLMYDRGVLYDSVGLTALARFDFMRALKFKPDLADAYNFMGIQHTLDGDFNQAYEAFDAALELKPEYQYAYLNRGIALMYDGKLSLAIADFQQYQQLKPSDPYRLLWLYFAQAQQNTQQAKSQLAVGATQLTEQDWGRQLVAFFLGEIDEQALLAAASSPAVDAKLRTEQLCEAYFYLAKWHSMQQHPTIAASYYKKVLSTNVYEFVEHRYARLELELLRQSVIADAKAATQTETSHEH